MRVLVTGGRGYLGSRLLKFLKEKYPRWTVRGVSRRPKKAEEVSCLFESSSSIDRMLAAARPDIIFHCVGTTLPGPWDLLLAAHLQPTVQLLESVRRSPGKKPRVVIVGSAAEYGPGRPNTRFLETTAPNPGTPYGISKSLQTTVALSYGKWGVPVIVARLFNLLAIDAPVTFAVSRAANALRRIPKGKTGTVRIGPGEAVRDYISVNDALRALTLIGVRGKAGEIYNVCSGKGVRMGDLFDALAEGAGVNVRWVSKGRGSPRSGSSYSVGNPKKIRRHVGWAPEEDSLESARLLMSTVR